jgi:hypothetical protein
MNESELSKEGNLRLTSIATCNPREHRTTEETNKANTDEKGRADVPCFGYDFGFPPVAKDGFRDMTRRDAVGTTD